MNPLTIRMKADGVAEMMLYGVVGDSFWDEGVTAKDFRKELKGIKVQTLNLRINSPGGSVFEASAIMAALDEFKGRIEVDVDGIAASAASVIAMVGDEIRMAPAAMMMIHNPHAFVVGGANDMRDMAELLDKSRGQLVDAYERHSKKGRDQIMAWMDAESWFTGQEAVDAGLADSVSKGRQVAACANFHAVAAKFGYRHVPAILAFVHNSKIADSEPEWGGVDKTALPALAFADHSSAQQSDWSYPHHWIEGAGGKNADGNWTTGTMYLHKGGLNAAWSAAQGGRSGKKASAAVIDHLEAHRKAIGLDKADAEAAWAETQRRKEMVEKLCLPTF